jgi:hypothetical protein
MLEYVASTFLGLAMIGCLLYVTIAAEDEEPPANTSQPDLKQ